MFEAGQVWTYETRPNEVESRIIVCRVKSDAKLGEIVHVQVNGLHFNNNRVPGGYSDTIGHMPYSGDASRSCLLELEGSGAELPAFEEGYQQWKSAYDSGNAGVWTAPVSEAIAGMEAAVNQLRRNKALASEPLTRSSKGCHKWTQNSRRHLPKGSVNSESGSKTGIPALISSVQFV